MGIAYNLRHQQAILPWLGAPSHRALTLLSIVVLLLCLVYLGGYRVISRLSFERQLDTITRCVSFYAGFILLAIALAPRGDGTRLYALGSLILVPAALFIGRIALHRFRLALSHAGVGVQRAAIIGTKHGAAQVFRRFVQAPELGYDILGFVSSGGIHEPKSQFTLGNIDELGYIAARHQLDVIFVLEWSALDPHSIRLAQRCHQLGLDLRLISDRTDELLSRFRVHDLTGVPLHGIPSDRPLSIAAKRGFDLVAGSIVLAILAPLFSVIGLVIKLDSPGPILFRQERLTRGHTVFPMFKFRTMVVGADRLQGELTAQNEMSGPMFKIRNDPRVTRIGRWLRRLSLDELPQLCNVLRGEMSLVGPRPPLATEAMHYESWQSERLSGLQGMTGLWQVSGRNDLSFEEMVLLDLYYLENQSFLFDLELLLATIPAIALARGAY